jgi:HEAT repeat protein
MLPFLTAKSTHTRLQAVQHFDRTLEAEAVPGLLALLRDPDGKIREAASAALQRIRFAHEQESLWTRAQNGIDARPEAALEKLLAQAKPTEPKPKRLLAIMSLGALGKPEALPFLIEWTEDQDAEIANAARAAATQIHLAAKK